MFALFIYHIHIHNIHTITPPPSPHTNPPVILHRHLHPRLAHPLLPTARPPRPAPTPARPAAAGGGGGGWFVVLCVGTWGVDLWALFMMLGIYGVSVPCLCVFEMCIYTAIHTETETDIHRDRHRDRDRDRQTDRQAHRHTNTQRESTDD